MKSTSMSALRPTIAYRAQSTAFNFGDSADFVSEWPYWGWNIHYLRRGTGYSTVEKRFQQVTMRQCDKLVTYLNWRSSAIPRAQFAAGDLGPLLRLGIYHAVKV
jgi:hypothetical protein